jgi:phosphopantothenoylcysteine decarboxylase/phosphopantothenate--cysteine ligase
MFQEPRSWEIEHISLAQKADLFIVVPATANMIGKIANGIADDMLSTTIMATKSPVIIAPAMNCDMFENIIVQKNIQRLQALGYIFVEPQVGRLACGDIGQGKLADVDDIIEIIKQTVAFDKDLKDLNVLVTAGPTREAIDPVRFITNHSSGKMGYSIAKVAKYRGAKVTLVSGPTNLKPIKGIQMIDVNSALEMYEAVMAHFEEADIIIKAAAVSDYRPLKSEKHKIKKQQNDLEIQLTKNPDILMELGKKVTNQVLIGFSMETQLLKEYAKEKLIKKNLDLIVANNLSEKGAGFAVDTNIATLINKNGDIENMPIMTKDELAYVILDKALAIHKKKH